MFCSMRMFDSMRHILTSWFGMHHLGIVMDNLTDSIKFYTEVMGGKRAFFNLTYQPGPGTFQDDILDTGEANQTATSWGIPDLTSKFY